VKSKSKVDMLIFVKLAKSKPILEMSLFMLSQHSAAKKQYMSLCGSHTQKLGILEKDNKAVVNQFCIFLRLNKTSLVISPLLPPYHVCVRPYVSQIETNLKHITPSYCGY